jgi:NADPH-dependent glutamate synthase beta subunit-like oxidoreductase
MSMAMKATLLSAAERLAGFDEVYRSYDVTQATIEANRCLGCEDAPCRKGCPAGIDVRGFIRKIRFGDYRGGVRLLREENILAGVCGRVCPTEFLCEERCRSQALTDPIRIGALQRFLTDWEMEVGRRPFHLLPATLRPVAVVGAGPAGLAAAARLRRLGHPVTIFEEHSYAGGAMAHVIPRFKLPRSVIDYEVQLVRDMGVEIQLGAPINEDLMPSDLLEHGYGAVLLAVGLQESYTLGIEGENLDGVYTAIDVLVAASSVAGAPRVHIGKNVIVVGGGSAALNAACSALRMGAETVNLTSRRTPAEMDAFENDKRQALEEGVQVNSRVRPTRILGENGRVVGLEGVRVTWKVPGSWSSHNVVDVPGSATIMPADTVVIAIGQRPDQGFLRCIAGLETAKNGCVLVDPQTGSTSEPAIFAAGDILAGPSRRTIVQSIAEGKAAALSIHQFLSR